MLKFIFFGVIINSCGCGKTGISVISTMAITNKNHARCTALVCTVTYITLNIALKW